VSDPNWLSQSPADNHLEKFTPSGDISSVGCALRNGMHEWARSQTSDTAPTILYVQMN